jgi:hypothetical protein
MIIMSINDINRIGIVVDNGSEFIESKKHKTRTELFENMQLMKGLSKESRKKRIFYMLFFEQDFFSQNIDDKNKWALQKFYKKYLKMNENKAYFLSYKDLEKDIKSGDKDTLNMVEAILTDSFVKKTYDKVMDIAGKNRNVSFKQELHFYVAQNYKYEKENFIFWDRGPNRKNAEDIIKRHRERAKDFTEKQDRIYDKYSHFESKRMLLQMWATKFYEKYGENLCPNENDRNYNKQMKKWETDIKDFKLAYNKSFKSDVNRLGIFNSDKTILGNLFGGVGSIILRDEDGFPKPSDKNTNKVYLVKRLNKGGFVDNNGIAYNNDGKPRRDAAGNFLDEKNKKIADENGHKLLRGFSTKEKFEIFQPQVKDIFVEGENSQLKRMELKRDLYRDLSKKISKGFLSQKDENKFKERYNKITDRTYLANGAINDLINSCKDLRKQKSEFDKYRKSSRYKFIKEHGATFMEKSKKANRFNTLSR